MAGFWKISSLRPTSVSTFPFCDFLCFASASPLHGVSLLACHLNHLFRSLNKYILFFYYSYCAIFNVLYCAGHCIITLRCPLHQRLYHVHCSYAPFYLDSILRAFLGSIRGGNTTIESEKLDSEESPSQVGIGIQVAKPK